MSTVVSDCFTIGSIVATRTCYNEEIDPQTKMLILKCPSSSGNPKRHDVNIVNLSLVSDVQIKREVSTAPEPPQSLNLHRLNTRVRNSIENKRRLVSALSACLDPEGQRLFLAIARIIEDVSWSGQNILVYNKITITPPYKDDSNDWVWEWSSRPDQLPPKDWRFKHPVNARGPPSATSSIEVLDPLAAPLMQQSRCLSVRRTCLFSRRALAAVVVTNLLSLLVGTGIGIWLSKRGLLPPRLIVLN